MNEQQQDLNKIQTLFKNMKIFYSVKSEIDTFNMNKNI